MDQNETTGSLIGRSGREGQGPFFVITMQCQAGVVVGGTYKTYGCPWSGRIGAALMRLTEGHSLADAYRVTEVELDRAVGGVPRHKRHLVPLAVSALRNAIGHL